MATTTNRRTAITADAKADLTMDKISAADFLEMLAKDQRTLSHVHWPEKKKYELHVEPEFQQQPVGRVIDVINEKKKVERELPLDIKSTQRESIFDLSERINPVLVDRIVEDISARVEARIAARIGGLVDQRVTR